MTRAEAPIELSRGGYSGRLVFVGPIHLPVGHLLNVTIG
jgi:hypothetical protein